MSLNKNVVVSFVVIGLLLCTTPAMMDESDASVSERFTENYLYYAQFEKQSIPYDDWYYVDYLYYIDGSEKDKQMDLYISDPQRYSISSSDDRELITSSPAGTLVNVYMCSNYYSEEYTQTISYNEQEKNATKILDPYGGVSFFVRAGDTLEITVNSLTLSNGTNTPRAYISVDYDQVYLNPSFSHRYTKSTEINMDFDYIYYAVYVEINYDVEGVSTPNGSATVYIAICAAITIIVFAVLVLASIKPKWSK